MSFITKMSRKHTLLHHSNSFCVGIQFHFGAKHQSGLPSNMEELDAQDRVGFSANRHKDISFGVVQSQTSSMFGGSFMSDQSSQGTILKCRLVSPSLWFKITAYLKRRSTTTRELRMPWFH